VSAHCKVVYVENNAAEARLLKEALSTSALVCELTVLEDGEEALVFFQAKKHVPDLILLDLELPKVHGLEVLQAIKEDPDLKNIPVVVFVSPRSQHAQRVKELGVASLPKPMLFDDYGVVIDMIASLCPPTGKQSTSAGL
jgi:CheY-like chemotaxis protein